MRHLSGVRLLRCLVPVALFPAMGCLTDFGPPSIDGDQVVFHGSVPVPASFGGFFEAIYMGSDDCLRVAADQFTPIPGGSGTFRTFGHVRGGGEGIPYVLDHGSPSFDAGEVAFWGSGGIYLRSGETVSVVADANTPVPGGTGNFMNFETNPSLRSGSVAFSTGRGIYLNDGNTIRLVMDQETLMPGFPNTVNFLPRGFSVDDGNVVAFRAGIQTVWPTGVYVRDGGSLRTVADYNTPIPNRVGTFDAFGRVSADEGEVAFVGGRNYLGSQSLDPFGIYRHRGGMLSMVADTTTAVPGGSEKFDDFTDVETSGGNIVFAGMGRSRRGLYQYSGSALNVVIDNNASIPGGTGSFVQFGDFSLEAQNVVFVGRGGNDQTGVYLYDGASLSVIADQNTSMPAETANFTRFGEVATHGGDVAFVGNHLGEHSGVYLRSAGSLEVVANRNTRIPPANSLFFDSFSEVSLDSGDILFVAGPNISVNGIYLYRGGSLSVIADRNTAVPDRARDSFSRFSELTADSGQVTFIGESVGGHRGIYNYDGNSIRPVVTGDLPFPGGLGNFVNFGYPWATEGSVAFMGTAPGFAGPQGVYQHDGNGIHIVADSTTPIPAGVGTFQFFGMDVSADGGDVLFTGGSSSQPSSGVYLASGESLSVVADSRTSVPDGAGNFTSFYIGTKSLDGTDMVFLGTDPQSRPGIYLHTGGSLEVVADRNTPVPDGSGTFTKFEGMPALDGGNVAFLSDTPKGIYLYDGNTLKVIADTSRVPPRCSSGLR
jgi:hypothetical protein